MDRVDVVVIEADELFSGDYLVERIHPVQGAEFDEIHPRVTSLFDLDDPETRRVEGHWMLGTLSTLDVVVDETTRCRVERLGETGGPVLLLTCEGEVRAFVETRPRLDPEAERLVHSAKRADLECLVAVSDARRRAVPETFGIVEREALIRELRSLQLQRRCVALVADADRSDALAAADLGIGLRRSGENPPWRADLVVDGPLERAGEVLEACGLARDVARQSVSLAEIGATMGVFLSLQGLESTNPGHVKLAVNTVALVALANGVRKVFELEGREPPPRRESTPWHALAVEEVLERLDTDRTGLSPEQVQARYEPPVPEPSNASQWGRAMGRELSNPLTPVLGAAAAVSAIVGSTGDAGLVTAVVLFNAAISGTERFRAEQALDALADSHVPEVRVRRRGRWRDLEADALVPGDVLHLEAGDIVPADCRIASARDLEVDESSLTGESVPVEKSADRTFAAALADRHSMVYAGTSIAGGEAEVVAVAVGSQTEARRGLDGRPLHHPETGIQARLRALTDVTVPAAGMAGVLLLVAGLVRQQDISRLADTGVGMAVAAVPEGLPLLATVAERATARRLSERDVLVRNPRSLEALARVDILCADKTGTLTEGRLELHRLDDGDRTVRLDGTLEAWQRRLLAIARRATPEARGADERQLPHPTDRAVVEGARRFGVDGEEDVGPFERLKTLPFQPRRGYCAVQIETSSGSRRLAMKGAPEVVLNKCDRRATDDGVEPLSPSERRRLEDRAERMAATGLRTLAVAERRADTPVDDWDEATTERMVFHGLLGLRDPPRPEARRAIERLREAGVEVLMITGDHRRTAEHVADELDLEADSVLTGPDLDRLDDDDLAEALSETSVIARTSPTQKGRIVEALQADDKVVAMTGDGANDAPAIRLAEVGMALGEKSTRATRDAADLVLADERLEAIVRAIGESRAMMEAVRDATSILTGGNFGEIGFTVLASLLSQEAPLNARQLLLVNLLTDVAPSMSIAVRTPTDDDLEAHLAGEMDGWLDAGLEHDIALRAVTTMGGATSAWGLSKGLGCDPARSSTVALLSLVGTQLAQTIAVDHPTRETLAAGLGSAMVLFGTVMTPGIGRFFRSRPVGPVGLAIAAGASTATTATSWLGRRLYRRWREWRDD
jgi:cation-transporting ATPase I